MKNPPAVAKSASACAILGLLAYRAGHAYSDRPAEFRHPWQLEAWQQGWATGYDSARHHMVPKQAYSLAWVTLHNDINQEHSAIVTQDLRDLSLRNQIAFLPKTIR